MIEGCGPAQQPRNVKFVGLYDGFGSGSKIESAEDMEVTVKTYGAADLDVAPGAIVCASGDLCVMPNGQSWLDAYIVSAWVSNAACNLTL